MRKPHFGRSPPGRPRRCFRLALASSARRPLQRSPAVTTRYCAGSWHAQVARPSLRVAAVARPNLSLRIDPMRPRRRRPYWARTQDTRDVGMRRRTTERERFLRHPLHAVWVGAALVGLVVVMAIVLPAQPLAIDQHWSEAMRDIETPLSKDLALVFDALGRGVGRVPVLIV